MKSAGILRYSSLPGYGHGQKQRIKPCFVKALADVFAGCAYDQGFVGRRVFQHFKLMRGLRRTFAAGERHYIFNLLPEQICQGMNMRRPLAENQAVSVFVNAGKDIIHNAMIPKIVLLKPRIVFADSHGVIVLLVLKARAHESGNQKVRKWAFLRLRFSIYPIADRPQIHVQNGMMTILSGGGCGQAVYILRTNAFECLLKADCRHMMTFVDDDHAVVADPRFDCVCVSKGLQQGNVDDAAAGISSTAVLSDQFAFLFASSFLRDFRQLLSKLQELRKTFFPLLGKLSAMDEN